MQLAKKGPFILVFCILILASSLIGCARVAETPSTLNVFENAPLDTTQIAVSTVTIGGVAVTREVISNQVCQPKIETSHFYQSRNFTFYGRIGRGLKPAECVDQALGRDRSLPS